MNNRIEKSKLREALRRVREDLYQQILTAIIDRPELTYREIGNLFGASESTVWRVAQRGNVTRPVGPRPRSDVKEEGK